MENIASYTTAVYKAWERFNYRIETLEKGAEGFAAVATVATCPVLAATYDTHYCALVTFIFTVFFFAVIIACV